MEEKLDKFVFRKQSFKEADSNKADWLTESPSERFNAIFILSLRTHGYDPNNPPKMDKTICKTRKHEN